MLAGVFRDRLERRKELLAMLARCFSGVDTMDMMILEYSMRYYSRRCKTTITVMRWALEQLHWKRRAFETDWIEYESTVFLLRCFIPPAIRITMVGFSRIGQHSATLFHAGFRVAAYRYTRPLIFPPICQKFPTKLMAYQFPHGIGKYKGGHIKEFYTRQKLRSGGSMKFQART